MLSTSSTPLPTKSGHVLDARELPEKLVGFDTLDHRARPFNLLRAQVARLAAAGARRIGVTSPAPEVGKTFVASNLAAALSRLPDFTTYLFDLDLRRGSVAEAFGLTPEQGIAEYLAGQVDDLETISWQIEGQTLVIFPTRGSGVASSELLASRACADMVMRMGSDAQHSVCICDLPPAFANDDAAIASEMLDGYLLIVEDGVTTVKQVEDAIRFLGREKMLGTVLNRYVRGLGGEDYGYGYGPGIEKKYAKYYSR